MGDVQYAQVISDAGSRMTHAARFDDTHQTDPVWITACGLTISNGRQVLRESESVACIGCLVVLGSPLHPSHGHFVHAHYAPDASATPLDHPPGLTVTGMCQMAWETIEANGFHDDGKEVLTPDHPQARVAALFQVALKLAAVVEAIRKDQDASSAIGPLLSRVRGIYLNGLGSEALDELPEFVTGEDVVVEGSKTQLIARLMLIISEAAEAIEAVLNDDWREFGFENADILLRIGDMITAYNRTAAQLGRPVIDLEAMVLAKNAKNRSRGYRHGGRQV